MSKKRLIHPINVIGAVAIILVTSTWTLALLGFVLGRPSLYAWAVRILILTAAVSMTPLIASLVGITIERVRGDRHS